MRSLLRFTEATQAELLSLLQRDATVPATPTTEDSQGKDEAASLHSL